MENRGRGLELVKMTKFDLWASKISSTYKTYIFRCLEGGGVVGVLPSKRLMGLCRWMGSHFHNWIDYNGVTFW